MVTLEGLPHVVGVKRLDHGYLRIRHHPGADVAEALAQRAVAEDWGLFELAPEQNGLEEIFVSLTFGEQGDPSPRKPDQ